MTAIALCDGGFPLSFVELKNREVVGIFFGQQDKYRKVWNLRPILFENLILVQDECWRRALSMQVERTAR